MERIREQQEFADEFGFCRCQYRCLSSTVGMTAEQHAAWDLFFHERHCSPKSLLIAFRASSWRWTMWSRLPERKIAAENRRSCFTECFRQRNEERSIAIGSGSMRQYQRTFTRTGWVMQHASNRHFFSPRGNDLHTIIHIRFVSTYSFTRFVSVAISSNR